MLPGQNGLNVVPGKYEFQGKCLGAVRGGTAEEIGEDLEVRERLSLPP
jgi:hypothetical protein